MLVYIILYLLILILSLYLGCLSYASFRGTLHWEWVTIGDFLLCLLLSLIPIVHLGAIIAYLLVLYEEKMLAFLNKPIFVKSKEKIDTKNNENIVNNSTDLLY